MQLIEVAPSDLSPNPWNTNHVSASSQHKLVESLRRHGFVRPVIARSLEDGTLQILGGQHRVEAAVTIGLTQVPVVILPNIDERRAKEIGLIDNARYGEDDAIGLAELISELGDPDDLASFLPFIDQELALLNKHAEIDLDTLGLDEEEQSQPAREKRAAKTHQVMRFKIAVEDADEVADYIRMVQQTQGYTESDKLTNAGDALVWIVHRLMKLEKEAS